MDIGVKLAALAFAALGADALARRRKRRRRLQSIRRPCQ
jgi:hypothetical protein